MEEGREEGREQGREEGREQGREEGKQEGTEARTNKLIHICSGIIQIGKYINFTSRI